MTLQGIHHLTAVTADAARNHVFYTQTLGMRLVKRTVNQDDVSAYHLFYADGLASPGSDITFFDWPVGRERRGTHSICRTHLRVAEASSSRRASVGHRNSLAKTSACISISERAEYPLKSSASPAYDTIVVSKTGSV
jgi:catechol 2,3-dioxygenase-like lactoylglutathione lyase family enzyme